MRRTVRLKLLGVKPGELAPGMVAFRDACNHLATQVETNGCEPTQTALHAHYCEVRVQFGLMSMAACNAERHVQGAYATLAANGKKQNKTKRNNGAPRVMFRKPFAKLTFGRDWRFRGDKLSFSLLGKKHEARV